MIDAEKPEVKQRLIPRPQTPFQRLLDYACVINGIDTWYKLHQVCERAYSTTQTWTLQGVLRWRDREAMPDDYRLLCIADLAEVSMEYALICRGASSAETPAAIMAWREIEALALANQMIRTPDWDRFEKTLAGDA